MLDTTPLSSRVDRLAERLRAAPQSVLRRGAAASGLALARELARRAQLLEFPGQEPYELPDAGPFAVGDQLAVAGHDLANALLDRGTAGASTGETTGGGSGEVAREGAGETACDVVAEAALAEAVRLVDAELTAGSAPPRP